MVAVASRRGVWMLMGAGSVLSSLMSPAMAGWEAFGIMISIFFLLPGVAMIYYLLRLHVKQYFE